MAAVEIDPGGKSIKRSAEANELLGIVTLAPRRSPGGAGRLLAAALDARQAGMVLGAVHRVLGVVRTGDRVRPRAVVRGHGLSAPRNLDAEGGRSVHPIIESGGHPGHRPERADRAAILCRSPASGQSADPATAGQRRSREHLAGVGAIGREPDRPRRRVSGPVSPTDETSRRRPRHPDRPAPGSRPRAIQRRAGLRRLQRQAPPQCQAPRPDPDPACPDARRRDGRDLRE